MESAEEKVLREENLRLKRQLEIENALEKIRVRATAMRGSHELAETSAELFHQLRELKINVIRTGVGIFDDPHDAMELWITAFSEKKELIKILDYINIHIHPVSENLIPARKAGKPYVLTVLKGAEVKRYYEIMSSYLSLPGQKIFHDQEYFYSFFFEQGVLNVIAAQALTEEECQVLIRFANVFGLIYTRFLDLQKAETQTREAQIETALERVRAKAMAMHEPGDLSATINTFYKELGSLKLTPRRCGVGLINKDTREAELSTMNTTAGGISMGVIGTIRLANNPVLEGVYEHWLTQTEYHPVLGGQELRAYNQLLGSQIEFPENLNENTQYGYFFFFDNGGVYAWTDNPMSDEELRIFRKFTAVLSLTYKRYKDLKDAHVRAREAVKQATLDRVRAEIASMRTKEDLDRITPLIWRELTTLGIPFVRCGVFIMDNLTQQIHTFLSTPEGKAIAAFHLPYHTPGKVGGILSQWKKNEEYIEHWDIHDFEAFADLMVGLGPFSKTDYMSAVPTGGIYLHCLPFLQGMFYVGNTTLLDKEEVELVHSIAEAFSTAYARYEDFNKLEAAKEQVENTLADLKQAQTQLIQSEKMASLGELTAGIAHEIQNPLNFVNNFSEVSKELLEEMSTALDLGDMKDAKTLAKSVIENLDKINHHGKRADSIVKGMLQHSRTSTNVKELTDINVLVDEYVRLCYHGLRAKDKSFNATIKTDYDPNAGKVSIVAQDIGRVILNLLTNAFYAVSQKKSATADSKTSYEATVSIQTKRAGNHIEVSVSDNGNGIPKKVQDKIFQPFFTTKPTGQGTGLGLSLSYDIVKAHAGEIRMETTDGSGTRFTVVLP